MHVRDEDCTRFRGGCCVDCGAAHGWDPAWEATIGDAEYGSEVYEGVEGFSDCDCGGRAFHREGCSRGESC